MTRDLDQIALCWEAIEKRLGVLEAAAADAKEFTHAQGRWEAIEERVGVLEAGTQLDGLSLEQLKSDKATGDDEAVCQGWEPQEITPNQQRLTDELAAHGVQDFAFRRVASSYYTWPLEGRRQALNAASIHHLCKSMVMVNTRIHSSGADGSDPLNPKYIMVVIQYSARLNAEKLKAWAASLKNGSIPKKYYNMRLAPEADSGELTGYIHNAVTPIGSKQTGLPIILSHRIAALPEDTLFWLGAGEVDLKVGMPVKDFIQAYGAHVVDCTYDDVNVTQITD